MSTLPTNVSCDIFFLQVSVPEGFAHFSVNISLGPKEDRVLITGLHTVADVYCNCCQACLGWKYVEAFEESQKYKEGKCIIEKAKMVTDVASKLAD